LTLIDDLREARERLAANSNNSSRPPRSDVPWLSASPQSHKPLYLKNSSTEGENKADTVKPKVGHQVGTPGHGRALTLPVSATHVHILSHCAVCGEKKHKSKIPRGWAFNPFKAICTLRPECKFDDRLKSAIEHFKILILNSSILTLT